MADQSTGSNLFTNSATVNVSITAVPMAPETPIAAYLVTETPDTPAADNAGWNATFTSCAIAGGPGTITLYAWAKDAADGISAGKPASIYFNTAAPVMTDIAITAGPDGSGTATVTWNTDIPAQGSVEFGATTMSGATPNEVPENALTTAHSVPISGLAAGTNCKWIVVSNEVAAPAFWWPSIWPITGDCTRDCRVNILDLIFIRNRLNQAVTTGDNIFADVTKDTRINILDLIAVRNKLNTTCPP